MPTVSIIVPCYNEQDTIGLLLLALARQTYPQADMEVVIADGLSIDGTRQKIEAFQLEHPGLAVRVLDNQYRTIPSGLNRAIRQAAGDYIIRLDAHSIPAPDYVQRCVTALQNKLGDNVGGVWQIEPGGNGWLARAIAFSAGHPFGAGDARYRVGGRAQAVDTVPFGAFHRSLVERAGFFDETLHSNEDYEFNVRVRQAGGTVWMDPSIRTRYFARPSLGALARQYLRYGYWKARMLKRYPQSLRWRQMLPPAFVLGVVVTGIAAILFPSLRAIWLTLVGLYLLALVAAGVQAAVTRRDLGLLPGVPLALATMHICWGSAFLWSLLKR